MNWFYGYDFSSGCKSGLFTGKMVFLVDSVLVLALVSVVVSSILESMMMPNPFTFLAKIKIK